MLLGCILAFKTSDESVQALDDYLHIYLQETHQNGEVAPTLWAVIWELCRWPVFVFFLGFTSLGAIAIPVVFCIRGFLLSYAVSSFLHIFGRAGTGTALILFGISTLVIVPVLFLLASWAFPSALHLANGVWKDSSRYFPLRGGLRSLGFGVILLVAAVILQWSVMPRLLATISGSLFPS